jgi:hypothetical protein
MDQSCILGQFPSPRCGRFDRLPGYAYGRGPAPPKRLDAVDRADLSTRGAVEQILGYPLVAPALGQRPGINLANIFHAGRCLWHIRLGRSPAQRSPGLARITDNAAAPTKESIIDQAYSPKISPSPSLPKRGIPSLWQGGKEGGI